MRKVHKVSDMVANDDNIHILIKLPVYDMPQTSNPEKEDHLFGEIAQ